MDKPIYVGFVVIELSQPHIYETHYDKLQPYFGQEKLHLHYMDTDSFVFSVNTIDIIEALKNIGDLFDFSNLNENHELFSNKNKKVIGKFKIDTPKKNCIDDFICLRSTAYSFKCKCDDERQNKLKGVSKSQSIHIKIEEYKKCLDGEDYQKECDNYIIRSLNHEMYLQQIEKSTLSLLDDKSCYKNYFESIPWE